MRYLFLALLALVIAMVQHARLVEPAWAPDLPVALLAWVVAAGHEDRAPLRAWLIGTARDLVDPASLAFHAVLYTVLSVALVPVTRLVQQQHAFGWLLWAACAVLLVELVDLFVGGRAGPGLGATVLAALLTGFAACVIGWLLAGLPERLRPLSERELPFG